MARRRDQQCTIEEDADEVLLPSYRIYLQPGASVTSDEIRSLVGSMNIAELVVDPCFITITFARHIREPWTMADQLGKQPKFRPYGFPE